jgi:hypothetical protein
MAGAVHEISSTVLSGRLRGTYQRLSPAPGKDTGEG